MWGLIARLNNSEGFADAARDGYKRQVFSNISPSRNSAFLYQKITAENLRQSDRMSANQGIYRSQERRYRPDVQICPDIYCNRLGSHFSCHVDRKLSLI